jgi:hypothetical protein
MGFGLLSYTPCRSSSQVRITQTEAERIVSTRVKKHKTGSFWNQHPKLKDVTPPEVWRRLGGQIFKQADFTGTVDEVDSYFIRNRSATSLGIGFGGSGLISACVSDLDGDGRPELLFTYSWGSGLHRSHLAMLRFDGLNPEKTEADFVYRNYDMSFVRSSDREISVVANGKRLGKVIIIKSSKSTRPDVHWDHDLSNALKKLIWKAN